ncbi:glycosyltransferase [Natronomonas sp. CBA1123]|uniref:glycosyltransferase family 4 protein n=1 Tax=Natronomonas sp. CBA1123 TaxID=2668070 RepID=UPI0012E9F849|nr:glycosyltransferase family 4 protein [Natronomonas sp. CBA1123]MUV85120.1 glycosyltransferase [Natronomonas sp. CBA1123]
MRILRIAQKVYPDVTGGGPYHVHAMSRDQAAMGHDVTVLTVGEGARQEERDGYTIVRRPAIAKPLGNAIAPGIARFLRTADGYDVIHAHSHLYASTNLAAVARRFGETPLAVTNHGLYSQTAPEWVFDIYLKTLGRWTFNRADVVFCYTDADRQRLRNRSVTAPIEVVSNGIDTGRFSSDGPESELIESTGPVVLFVGRLVDGKRPEVAVEAFAKVRDVYPDAQLYLCGDGPLRDDLEKQTKQSGIESAVTFLGHLSYDEMPAVYRSVDVLVLPSRAEGLPRTVLEAMASGVSVVVSDLEQIQEIVGAGCRPVDGDADEFADAITASIRTNNVRGSERVEEYQWSDTVAQTTEVLESIRGS